VIAAIRAHAKITIDQLDRELMKNYAKRIILAKDAIRITLNGGRDNPGETEFSIPWQMPLRSNARHEGSGCPLIGKREEVLVRAIARAHYWLQLLEIGKFDSIEALAASVDLHPKVIRAMLRLAFLSPNITAEILSGRQVLSIKLKELTKSAALSWLEQSRLLGVIRATSQVANA